MKTTKFFILTGIILLSLSACKKNKVAPTPTPPKATRQEFTLDSIFLYAKQIYYWNDRLPDYDTFNPRQFTSGPKDIDNYNQALLKVAKYSNPYEWQTGNTSAKFSYIFDKANKNPTSSINTQASVDLEGNGDDFGIRFGLYGSESNYIIYVTAVYDNSPAQKAGFKRGDIVTKINNVSYGSNYSSEVGPLNTALGASSVKLKGIKNDGTTSFDVSLNKAVFKSSPIYNASVFTADTKKIGYLAYARFSNSDNSIAKLDSVFDVFSTKGVTDLIIDLRYNGGGYVNTAEHLINLIAPSSVTGTMFSEYYNSTMQNGNATIMKNQPLLDGNGKIRYGNNGQMLTYADVNYTISGNTSYFSKKGTLNNVQDIVFLVSGNTASASELVINSLKPHMTVKLVGKTTYGKPIGFFPITLENKYDVYFSMFETKNSAGQGGYYAGMTPDVIDYEVPDGTVMYDFGDIRDNYISKALNILASGSTVTTSYKPSKGLNIQGMPATSQQIHADFLDKEFKGMIENRIRLKK